MGSIDRRRDQRFRARIRGSLAGKAGTILVTTEDVSLRGVFFAVETPPAYRELVILEMLLPTHDTKVTLTGIVARVAAPNEHRSVYGVGVNFHKMTGVDAARWRQFVRHVREDHPESANTLVDFIVPEPAPAPPKNAALPAGEIRRIRLRLRTRVELEQLYETNIKKGGIVLPSDGEIAQATPILVDIIHPETGAVFRLPGKVKNNVQRATFTGVGIELEGMTPRRREDFLTFINTSRSGRSMQRGAPPVRP